MLIYDKGFKSDNIIGLHDKKIKKILQFQMNPDDLFINTTWIEYDKDLKNLLKQKSKRVFCYSGPDWENTICRSKVHKNLKKFNPIYIGNSLGKYYFSFWLDFALEYHKKYINFNTFDIADDLKHFMCLNRKPHQHRVELVDSIKHLIKYGYVSLGSNPPIILKNDIINHEGDLAAGGTLKITNDITGLGHKENWNRHFLNVVTETTIHTDVFLSEKIFKPILGKRPFIVLGDSNVYQVLKNWGFDTFDDLFGEGYNGKWHTDRITWISDVLENLVKEKNLKTWLYSLKPRLDYNYNQFFKVALDNRKNMLTLLSHNTKPTN